MPRKHYAPSSTADTHLVMLTHECSVLYEVLLDEVNQMRRAAGLPERTLGDIATVRGQVIARLQAGQASRGEP